jgi:hypothetical protein
LNESIEAIGHPESIVLETADSNSRLQGGTFSPYRYTPFVVYLCLILTDPMIGHCAQNDYAL